MSRSRVKLRSLGEKIKYLRSKKKCISDYEHPSEEIQGITQEQFAKEMNVSLDTVKNWEQGYNYPTIDMLMKITEYFECDPNYLLTENTCTTEDIQYISDVTGLTEEAIRFLSAQKKVDSKINLLNIICKYENGLKLYEDLIKYIYSYQLDTVDNNLSELLENVQLLGAAGPILSLSSDDFKKMYCTSIMNDIQYQLNNLLALEADAEYKELLCTGIYANLCVKNNISPTNKGLQKVIEYTSNNLTK